MKFLNRSLHDKVLILIGWTVAIIMVASACFLDSENWAAFLAVMLICSIYLGLFTYANADRGGIL